MPWTSVFCVLLVCVVVCCGEQCHAGNPSSIKFSITSEHNQTGHWIANVTVDHADYRDEKREWRLDVEQRVEQCQDIDSVLLFVTVTGVGEKRNTYKDCGEKTLRDHFDDGGVERRGMDPSGSAPPRRPGQDFKPGLGYYKLHTNAQTWLAARHTCTQEGAHLLIVNSDDEFATVKGIWDKHPELFQDWRNDYVHIGITDLAEEGNFTTMFGEPLNMTGYARWGNGEPSHGKTANCGRLSRTGQLFDSYCTNELAFFCEQ